VGRRYLPAFFQLTAIRIRKGCYLLSGCLFFCDRCTEFLKPEIYGMDKRQQQSGTYVLRIWNLAGCLTRSILRVSIYDSTNLHLSIMHDSAFFSLLFAFPSYASLCNRWNAYEGKEERGGWKNKEFLWITSRTPVPIVGLQKISRLYAALPSLVRMDCVRDLHVVNHQPRRGCLSTSMLPLGWCSFKAWQEIPVLLQRNVLRYIFISGLVQM
jgi:hypothetical protein